MSERRSHQWLPPLMALVMAALFGPATTADSPEPLYKSRPVSEWVEALQSKDVAQRRNAAASLTQYDPSAHAIVPALLEALKDDDAGVRGSAATAIGALGEKSDIPRLLEAIQVENLAQRAAAIRALGALCGSSVETWDSWRRKISPVPIDAIDALRVALRDADLEVRKEAVEALGRVGREASPSAPDLAPLLGDPGLRAPSALALHGILDPGDFWKLEPANLFPALVEALHDPRAETRLIAVGVLEEATARLRLGDGRSQGAPQGWPSVPTSVVTALIASLGDDNRWVRYSAARALGEIGPQASAAVPALVAMMLGDGEYSPAFAARALARIGPQAAAAAVDALVGSVRLASSHGRVHEILKELGPDSEQALVARVGEMLEDPDADVRLRAACLLVLEGHAAKPLLPVLIRRLRKGTAQDRFYAAMVLGSIGSEAKEAVPALITAVRARSTQVRGGAIQALEKIGPAARAAVPALLKALDDSDENNRRGACYALRAIGPEVRAAAPRLGRKLADKSADVRFAAVEQILGTGPEAARALQSDLILALHDSDARVREGCATALGITGSGAPEVVAALNEALKDPDPVVRSSAEIALGWLGADPARAIPAS